MKQAHVLSQRRNSVFLWGWIFRFPAFDESRLKNRVRACPVSMIPRNPA